MFEYIKSVDFGHISSSLEFPSSLKLIKFIDDKHISFMVNNQDSYVFYKVAISGEIVCKYEYNSIEDYILDYIFIGDNLYIAMCLEYAAFDEDVVLYKIDNKQVYFLASFPRSFYQHDMDYFYMFNKNNQLRLLIIRHTRLYLYTVDETIVDADQQYLREGYDYLIELAFLDGSRWILNHDYAVNIKDDVWEIYNTDLSLITSFIFSNDNIDWMGITKSMDGSILALACDNADKEKGLLCIYDIKNNAISTHTQKYGYYSVGIIDSKIFTSLVSAYSDIGGIMVFDKDAALKYAHIKDEKEGVGKHFNPSPVFYQALAIEELRDNKGLISTENKLFITDLTCRVIQELPFVPYENYALSDDKNYLALLIVENKKNDLTFERNLHIDFYKWTPKLNKANILTIQDFRNV